MKKFNIYSLLTASLFALVVTIVSCKKDYKNGNTATVAVAGEWVVTTAGDDGSLSPAYALLTYNTAANKADSLWIDDGNNYYGLKARINCNVSNLTFNANNADELYFGVQVTITDGKILKNAAIAPSSKDKTDSIYFKAKFTGDPVTYTYSGYRRTGFAGDDK
ncbi:MAG: hypothetical protein JWR50_2580 [Mucilaginibacter sp.]|nr:hypothetical protein [Mucilaginibacter sp.]